MSAEEVAWVTVGRIREVDRQMTEVAGVWLRMMENAERNLAVLARHPLGDEVVGRRAAAERGLAGAGADVAVTLSGQPRGGYVAERRLETSRPDRRPGGGRQLPPVGDPELVIDALPGYS